MDTPLHTIAINLFISLSASVFSTKTKRVMVPLEQELYKLRGTGEGSVRGKEDPAVVLLLSAGAEEVVYQELKGSRLQTPHLAGSVLHEGAARTLLTGVGGGRDGLPEQGDPIYRAVLKLLSPLLHWVLGMAEVRNKGVRLSINALFVS